MKKLMSTVVAGIATLVLSGCGGGSSDFTSLDVNYLTDELGYGVSGIYYECNTYYGTTDNYGAFEFDPAGDDCDFYLDGMTIDLYIMDEFGGVNGLPYDCFPSRISGFTGDFIDNGGFDYATNDICTISYWPQI